MPIWKFPKTHSDTNVLIWQMPGYGKIFKGPNSLPWFEFDGENEIDIHELFEEQFNENFEFPFRFIVHGSLEKYITFSSLCVVVSIIILTNNSMMKKVSKNTLYECSWLDSILDNNIRSPFVNSVLPFY